MNKIEYIKGDLFNNIPQYPTNKIIIPHIVNNLKIWGSGFVIPLGNYFPKAKNEYISMDEKHICLGNTQIIDVGNNIFVANMFAQDGISPKSTGTTNKIVQNPIRYGALAKCLLTINSYCTSDTMILSPKFGSLRAGGDWSIIENLIIYLLDTPKKIKIFEF